MISIEYIIATWVSDLRATKLLPGLTSAKLGLKSFSGHCINSQQCVGEVFQEHYTPMIFLLFCQPWVFGVFFLKHCWGGSGLYNQRGNEKREKGGGHGAKVLNLGIHGWLHLGLTATMYRAPLTLDFHQNQKNWIDPKGNCFCDHCYNTQAMKIQKQHNKIDNM